MMRVLSLLVLFFMVTACAVSDDLEEPPVYLGDFSLGHNVVVASKAQTSSTVSREVSEEQLTTALQKAIADRFDRYEGARKYHFGVSIEGYVLARGGVPVVAAPKSAMIIRVTVWDDAKGKKLNVPPEQMTIIEDFDSNFVIGSGWTQSAETQLEGLAENAAKAIETFLVAQNAEKGWFGGAAPALSEDEATASGTVLNELQQETAPAE